MRAAIVQLIILITMARLLEVVTSRLRLIGRRKEVEPWFPAIACLHAAILLGSLGVALQRESPPMPVVWTSLGMLAVATLLRAWIFLTLRSRWNLWIVDPGEIATTGPYRFVRHPHYLAVILEVAAIPLLAGAWEIALMGTIANAILLSFRIPFEERVLRRHRVYRTIMMGRPRLVPWPGHSVLESET